MDVYIGPENRRVFLVIDREHNVVRKEVTSWCHEHTPGWEMRGSTNLRERKDHFVGRMFTFTDANHALMFKLTWGGE